MDRASVYQFSPVASVKIDGSTGAVGKIAIRRLFGWGEGESLSAEVPTAILFESLRGPDLHRGIAGNPIILRAASSTVTAELVASDGERVSVIEH